MFKGRMKEGGLPSDPRWIVIETSDGDMRRWPANTDPNPDAEGSINYMKPVVLEDGNAIKWRITVGQGLAKLFEYDHFEEKNWVLKEWPSGYQFYDHHKGRVGGAIRHDLYLIGSENVGRFRSPQEFIPHAYWLMTDKSLNRLNCVCKYCTRKPQREISDALGISPWSGSPSQARMPLVRPRDDALSRQNRPKGPNQSLAVFATVQKQPKPLKLPKGPTQFVVPERENDLRAALCPKTLSHQRWARNSELVWVKLDHPIVLEDTPGAEEIITFWPGFIEDKFFKADIQAKDIKGKGTSKDKDERIEDPWTITHKWFFKIKLLVVMKTVLYGDDHILPYQSHAPSPKLLCAIESVYVDVGSAPSADTGDIVLPPTSEESAEESSCARLMKLFEQFDPFPEHAPKFRDDDERRTYFTQASGPFVTAIQIASRVAQCWTPTDEWEYKMVPQGSSRNGLPMSPSRPERQNIGELNQRAGASSSNARTPTTQMRFQGLWWGPERIWMDDLVRLKLARYQFAPKGTTELKKASGAGKSAKEELGEDLKNSSSSGPNITKDSDTIMREYDSGEEPMNVEIKISDDIMEHEYDSMKHVGASSRSLFLRIEGLFVAHVPREDGSGTRPECRISGMLYELADEDWEEDEPDEPANRPSTALQTNTPRPASAGPSTRAMSLADVFNLASIGAPQAVSSKPLFSPNPELLSDPATEKSSTDDTRPAPVESAPTSGLGAVPLSDSATVPMLAPSSISAATTSQPSPEDSRTALHSETETVQLAGPRAASSGNGSSPLARSRQRYPLPAPPRHCRFRPILHPTHEVVLPLIMLAGRYYPNLLMNPLLRDRVQAAAREPNLRRNDALWALEGHVAGLSNSIDPLHFIPGRTRMVREAERIACAELMSYWRSQSSTRDTSWNEQSGGGGGQQQQQQQPGVTEGPGAPNDADAMDTAAAETHVTGSDDMILVD